MNRATTTTSLNGYIRYGGRVGGGGASLSSSGEWDYHGVGVRCSNYDNSSINVEGKYY